MATITIVAAARGGQKQPLPLPDTQSPQQLREWVIQRAHLGGGGFGFLHTAQRRQQSASESAAAPGGSESAAALGAHASPATGPASAEALHTFTLDSGASRCFFRDSTTLTPLAAPVPVSLADPTGGPVVARASTVLPCPAVPSGSLSSLNLPKFLTNLVSNAAIQDVWVDTFIPGGQRVAISCSVLLVLVTLPPNSPLTPPPQSPLLAASPQHSPPSPCLWPSHVPALPPALTCPMGLPCIEGWQRAAPHSSEFPPTTSPLQTLHMDHKAHVSGVLIPWNHATHRQLRERFCRDLPVRRLHYDRGGEFSSDLLAEFCQDKGMRQMFTFPASPQQNGIAERCIGLIIEVACTSMIHAAAPHFLWPFAVRYAAYHLNLWARVSQPETSPTLRWTGKVGDASVFR
ncbi:unnamed protein product, partial [Closterium sp. NIES-54]